MGGGGGGGGGGVAIVVSKITPQYLATKCSQQMKLQCLFANLRLCSGQQQPAPYPQQRTDSLPLTAVYWSMCHKVFKNIDA